MLSSNSNPYLRPEYLNPPPTNNTMDSKKSPLALLAQTCSQIGADPATLKNGPPSSGERKKTTSESQNSKSSPVLSVDNNNRVPSTTTTTTTTSSDATPLSSAKNKKTTSSTASSENNNRLTPTTDRRSKSTSPKNPNRSSGSSSIQTLLSSTDQPSTAGTTTSVSTGLMSHLPQQQQHPASIHPSSHHHHHHHHLMMAAALAGQGSSDSSSLANSYKSLMAVAGMGPYGAPYLPPYSSSSSSSPGYGPPHPSAMDFGAYASALNAAKSSSSAGQQQSFIPTSSAAALMTGYLANHPAAAYSAALQQAMQYGNAAARANSKSNENGPPCRDPYCTGCPSNNNAVVATQMVCTAGCALGVPCDHLKIPIPAQHLQMISGPSTSPSSPHRPYVCNWIVGDNYCGKRFGSSDDLLQHLRTHTNLSADGGGPAFTGHHPSSMMRAAYPTPPLSPLSAARYHPYGKANPATSQPFHHPGMAAAMAAMAGPYGPPPPPPPSLFQHLNPALAPYYSHLSFFNAQANQPSSQRQSTLGPAPPGPP